MVEKHFTNDNFKSPDNIFNESTSWKEMIYERSRELEQSLGVCEKNRKKRNANDLSFEDYRQKIIFLKVRQLLNLT